MKRGARSLVWLAGLSSFLLIAGCARKSEPPAPIARPQVEGTQQYPNLAIQVKALNDAFAQKDYARFLDLIHPKVVEMSGGREQMLAQMTKELKEMESEGVMVLSSESGAPTSIKRDPAGVIYAVLPTAAKVRTQIGVFQSESTMIAVSSDEGANWKFIDASGKDYGELKKLLPTIADDLKLPPDKPPVKISN